MAREQRPVPTERCAGEQTMTPRVIDRRAPARVVTLVFLTAVSLAGCTTTRSYVSRMSHDSAKSAVEGVAEGVPSLPAPIREALRQTLLADDTLSQVSQRIAEAAVTGVRSGLTSPETRAYVDDLVSRAVATLGRDGGEATRQLVQAAEPELTAALRRAIAAAGVALGEDLDRELGPRTRAIAQATADVLATTLTAALEVQLAHLRQTARDIGRELISEAAVSMNEKKDFVGAVTHVAMLQAVRGARQGVLETLPGHVPSGVIAGTVVLGILVVAFAGALAVYWRRYRQSTKTLTIIAQQINEFEASELKLAIQKSAHANYVGPWLSNFLKGRGL
jgi:hypothetical protein